MIKIKTKTYRHYVAVVLTYFNNLDNFERELKNIGIKYEIVRKKDKGDIRKCAVRFKSKHLDDVYGCCNDLIKYTTIQRSYVDNNGKYWKNHIQWR